MNMHAPQDSPAAMADFLSAHLLAVRSVVDALIASHPDPAAFLDAHKVQLDKLRTLQDHRGGKPIGLEQAQAMHEHYSRKIRRS